jgi:hypothetical protein
MERLLKPIGVAPPCYFKELKEIWFIHGSKETAASDGVMKYDPDFLSGVTKLLRC